MPKESIEQMLDRASLPDIIRALEIVFENQTSDEQRTDTTRHTNKTGFSAADARFGSNMYKIASRTNQLSPRALAFTRRLLKKYWKQLDTANFMLSNTTIIKPKLKSGFHIIDTVTGDSIKYLGVTVTNIEKAKELTLYYQNKFKHPMQLKFI